MGLAKHMLDTVLSGILERWFLVFIGSNEASLSQLSFRLWPRALRAFVRTLADLYINAGWVSLKSSGPLSVETSTTLPPAPLFWLFEFINEEPQTWVISKNRSSPWVKSFLLTCSDSRLKVSLQLQALRSGECLKACHSSRDSTSTWPERMVTFLDIFKEHFRKKET